MRIPEYIESERVAVRPFRDEDLAAYLDFMTDERVTRHLLLEPEQKTETGARALFDYVRQSYATEEPVWALAIATEADGFIGSCGISPIDGTIFECYYGLLRKHWGRGYATEATGALLGYVFRNTSVSEIRAYMSPHNPNSPGVAARVGMSRKGLQMRPGFGNEGLLYSITKQEWESQHHD
jgi:RimJ/RimL family protein N-acetyltransferase